MCLVLVPPPTVTIETDRTDIFYTGTNLTLTCTVVHERQIDFPLTESITWSRNGQTLFGGNRTIATSLSYNTTNVTMLQFYPLKDEEDTGVYNCSVVLVPIAQPSFVEALNVTEAIAVPVSGESFVCNSKQILHCLSLALPSPNVTIAIEGQSAPGQLYRLNCIVETVPGLIVQPMVTWTKHRGLVESAGEPSITVAVVTGYSNTLEFSVLHTSDAGLYMCSAVVDISRVDVSVNASAESLLPLKSKFT